MKRIASHTAFLLVGALALGGAACSNDAFCFTCDSAFGADASNEAETEIEASGGTGGSGGTMMIDGGGSGGTSPLEAGPDGPDACSEDTQADPKNCGACGNVCELLGAFPKCVAGLCAIESCASGRVDLNHTDSDGCEYVCTVTNNGTEVCDGQDNDCNGGKDEPFDLTTDVLNCGACGNACALGHATPRCEVVSGFPTCRIDTCEDGHADIDGLSENGCEYGCPVNPPVIEECNGVDDDCDGEVNEDNPGGGQPCESNCLGGVCLGRCTAGTTLCVGTQLLCVAGAGPEIEVCNGIDDDCDGVTDNGFDVLVDPNNCGSCSNVCGMTNAVGGCVGGVCVISTCMPGFASIDGDVANGCEYACPVSPTTVESCNGMDDDCNGVVDDAAAVAGQEPLAALCYPLAGTPCAGTNFVCRGTGGWRCSYDGSVEVDGNGVLALVETRCDGIDGNCNGQVDEAFSDLGTACDNGQVGGCRDAGKRVCDPTDPAQTHCDLSFAPNPVPGAPAQESCNGVDDDCNGLVDDGIVDDMVAVNAGGLSFYVDRYEASRPDATSVSSGLSEVRRCVNPGVLPWTHTTQAEAAAACAATGARLCVAAELKAACEGATTSAYPYGSTYQPLACNGLDFDGVPGGTNDNVLLPTGASTMSACATADGIHDLSGNAGEWTSTTTGTTGAPQNLAIAMVKGGSYNTPGAGLTCQFSLSRFAVNAILPELGFRCCRN